MKNKSKCTLTPKLRFPEFRKQWDEVQLSQLANSISDRVGTMPCIPYTVTSGLGLVSQEEKFGRTIAGNSLRNYIRLQKDDFAYNKSATKAYPEGYIARYLDEAKAAVPKSIFTCFRVDSEKVDPVYLDFLFAGNLHGRWLRKFLTIGARAHGSLNVSDDDLMALPVPLPSPPEQQKIADCLSSLDASIAAEGRNLAALRDHKRGLMQQLFPQPGQTQPRLRFPEFRDGAGWQTPQLSDLYGFKRTNTLSRDKLNYEAGTIRNIHYGDIHTKFKPLFRVDREYVPFINPEVSVDAFEEDDDCEKGDIVLADASEDLNDVGKAIEVISLDVQRVVAGTHTILATRRGSVPIVGFGGHLFQSAAVRAGIQRESQGAKVYGISANRISPVALPLPPTNQEQQKIAACLTALDTRIAAQAEKIENLKQHKRGLMQQLFPAPEEVEA